MSGPELALAIVPLVIILVEHHRSVIRRGKALALSKISNDQQLDFYQELHAELTLLNVTLDRIKALSTKVGLSRARPEESQAELIEIALGNSAPHFQQILDRVMKSINDIVREKSSVLTRGDTVGA
jgi:signal transduction histidine kinase